MISALYESPVGTLTLVSNGAALAALAFDNPRYSIAAHPPGKDKVLDQARRELDAYFAGKLERHELTQEEIERSIAGLETPEGA